MNINFKLARLDDEHISRLLCEWRNDPEKMRNLGRVDPYTSEESWMEDKKCFPRLFMAQIEDVPFGTVLLLSRPGGLGTAWMVAPEYRGKGLGKVLAWNAARQFPGQKVAHIHPDNLASKGAAKFAGYLPLLEHDDMGIPRIRLTEDGYERWCFDPI